MSTHTTVQHCCSATWLQRLCLLAVLCAPWLCAQDQADWEYTLRPGDSIWSLTEEHCVSADYTQQVLDYNGLQAGALLQPGTRIRFPLYLLKRQPASAELIALSGDVLVEKLATGTARAAIAAEALHSGDRVITGTDASARIRFADGSELLMQQSSELVMDALSAWGSTGMVDTRVRLQSGRVDTDVQRQPGAGSRFEIITPTAITAVRGTNYRVAFAPLQAVMLTEVPAGSVAVNTPGSSGVNVATGFGLVTRPDQSTASPRALLPAPQLDTRQMPLRNLPIRLRWQTVADALAYRVQLAADDSFSSLIEDRVVDMPEVSFPDLADGNYALRLRAVDADGLEGYDSVIALQVDARPLPPQLQQIMPLTADPSPTLRWQTLAEASGYLLQMAVDAAFSQIMIDARVESNSYTPAQWLSPGRYHWRVAALDQDGERGPFAAPQSFQRVPPQAPDQSRAEVRGDEARLYWEPVEFAVSYRVQVATDAGFSELIRETELADSEVSLSALPAGDYFYRVRAIGPAGDAGEHAQTVPFVIEEPRYGWLLLLALPLLLLL